MDWKMRKEIENFTNAIRDVYDIQIPINNIDTIVKKLEGKVVEDPTLDFDGKVCRIGDSFEIHVSPWQSDSRRNFTIAHEIGHLFLHMGFITSDDIWNQQKNEVFFRNGYSEQEYQANEFAAALLMPEDEYIRQIEKNQEDGRVIISKIADYFNVSADAASMRGKWLGILEW